MRETGRWTVHRNPWYSVVRTDFVTDDGEQRQFFAVAKPDSVLVIATRAGNFQFVELARPTGNGLRALEFPQGSVDRGESPIEAAGRELREETGWVPAALSGLGTLHEASGFASCRTHVFATEVNELGPTERDAFEQNIAVVELGPREMRKAVREGRIVDGATLAAIAMLWAIPPDDR